MFSVEISTDGGMTWSTELMWDEDHFAPGENVSVDLSAYAGNASVLARYRYAGAGWDWWAQVDDVALTCADNGVGPIIEVDPTTVHSMQLPDTTNDETFDINNLGDADLVWNIFEDDVFPSNASPAGPGDAALAREDADTAAVVGVVPTSGKVDLYEFPQAVLWDNGPLVNCAGCGTGGADESVLQSASLAMTTLGFGHQLSAGNRVADEFDVTDASGWNVDQITFFAYQTGSTTASTITEVNLQIWDGPPNVGGSSVVFGDTTTNRLLSTGWSNIYRVSETTSGGTTRPIMANTVAVGTYLPQGTYWLDWQSNGTLASGPWAPPITVNGQSTTGNALQYTGSWAPALDGGTSTQQGFPFIVEGSAGLPTTACVVATDIPWATVSPMMGTTPGMGTDTVTVTFDSTGLVVGEYEGTLCIESNDPQNPLVEVLLQLWVEDNPTAVEMADLSAAVNADGTVSVNWVTAAEVGNAGFNVYRSVSADALGEMLNSELIGSTASAGAGAAYSFVDANVGSGTYYYWVQAVSVDGATTAHGPVEAVTQAPTSAGLTGFTGGSSMLLPLAAVAVLTIALLGGAYLARRKA
jgi:hypothetical protein